MVYKAKWNGQLVAVKQLHEALFNREINSHAPKAVEVFEEECKLLQNLKHANIVELLTFNLKSSPPVLITELLSVDLESHITNLHPNKVPFIILMEIINGNLPSPSTDSPFTKGEYT